MGQRPAAHHFSFDEHPRCVANRGDGLTLVEKSFDETDGVRIGAEFVSIHDATRKHKCVEILGIRLFEGNIHFEFIAFIVVIHPLNLTFHWRNNLGLGAGPVEGLSWLGQFNFLEAIGKQECDPFSMKVFSHDGISFDLTSGLS
jgi:hypothetical protein